MSAQLNFLCLMCNHSLAIAVYHLPLGGLKTSRWGRGFGLIKRLHN